MPAVDRPSIRLSRRAATLKASATLAVSEQIKQLRAEGVDVVGFGAGEPDFETPEPIKEAAIDALRSGLTHYMPVAGDPAARAAIAAKLRTENGIDCAASDVVISTGAKQSLYLALQSLLDPGDEVLVPTPAWVSYRPMVELAGGTVVEVPGAVDNDFRITPAQLEAAITPRVAAIIINSPSNPCGTMYGPDDLRSLAEVLEPQEGIVVISDEIYEKLIYGEQAHLSLGSLEPLACRTVTINGLSKAYAMTGWRIGYACAPCGEPSLATAMAKLQGQMTSNITSFCYPAIAAALEGGAEAVERMRSTFARRAELIHGLVSRWPEVICPRPVGAFYAFPDVSAHFGKVSPEGRPIDSSVAFATALLAEAHVAVVPGDDFGDCARGHVRLSFAASEEVIREGCERIDRWLRGLAPFRQ